MNYLIGVSNMNVALRPLIENRLPVQGKFTGEIKLLEQRGRFLNIEVSGRSALFLLADILADIIIEHLQIRYLMARLTRDYDYLSERDRSEILVSTVKRLWYGGGKEKLELKKKDVSSRVLVCLLECEGRLALDGVLHFRMKDCLAQWDKTMRECVEQYLMCNEKKEFIRLLRYLVCMRDPAVPYVEVLPAGEEYAMFDERGNQISVSLEEEADATKEDLLLSGLIDLAPEVIDLGHVGDSDLKGLLADIFVGRVRG